MRERFAEIRAPLASAASVAASWLKRYRAPVRFGSLGVLALGAAFAIGRSAFEAAEAYDREARRLGAVATAIDGWIARLQPPSPAESTLWHESDAVVTRLAAASTGPTAVARIVAARADEAGITGLRLRVLDPDSVAPPPPGGIGPWEIVPGDAAVAVEFVGDWPTVIAFVGALPPHVEVARIDVEPGPDHLLRARFALRSRVIAGGS